MAKKNRESSISEFIQSQPPADKDSKVYAYEKPQGASRRNGREQKNFRHEIANSKEDSLIEAIDLRRDIAKLVPFLEKLDKGALDVRGFVDGISPQLLKQMLLVAFNGESEKNRLDSLKHLLGIAGHSPTQKHEIGRLDPETPKQALISMLRGAKRDLQDEGIEVVEDDSDKPEGT